MNLTILSMSSTGYIVEAYNEVIRALKSYPVSVKHVGISLNLWYHTQDMPAYHAYLKTADAVYHLPRISGITTPFWYSERIMEEVLQSVNTLEAFCSRLIEKMNPDLFLIADDHGRLEASVIDLFHRNAVSVLFIQHGHNIPAVGLPIESSTHRSDIIPRTHPLSSDRHPRCLDAPGKNGDYLICSYSGLAESIMLANGIDPQRIRRTGFPYFDRVLAASGEKRTGQRRRATKKILFLGSGLGRYGRNGKTNQHFRFLFQVCKSLPSRLRVFVRLKTGENLQTDIDEEIRHELETVKVLFDDSSIPSYEAVRQYDLVIGSASTVLIESIISGTPAVLIETDADRVSPPRITLDRILKEKLGMRTLSHPSRLETTLAQALKPEYLQTLQNRLKDNESFFFHKLDGHAASRIANIIMSG